MSVMVESEVVPGVHAIDVGFEGVPLLVYLLHAGDWTVLDAGTAGAPTQRILPALPALGVAPEQVATIVNTHVHHDHRGGNGELLAACPNARLAVPEAEVGWAESIQRYLLQSQDAAFPGVFVPSQAAQERIARLAGADCAVDVPLRDGDELPLGDGGTLRATATPGHSPGHLVFLDPARSVLFSGDAIQGEGVRIEGRPWLFPYYSDVEVYAASLATVKAIDAETVCSSHYGVLDRAQLDALLATSRRFMGELDAHLLGLLSRGGPLTLADAVAATLAEHPGYQDTVGVYTTVAAHLDHIARRGSVRVRVEAGVKQWRLR